MEKKIELIPETRVTIKANSDGSTITIYEPETPSYQFKDGDFIYSKYNDETCIGILKGNYKGENEPFSIYCGIFGQSCLIDDSIRIGNERKRIDRLATDSEKISLLNKLKEKDIFYDYETHKIAKIKVGDIVSHYFSRYFLIRKSPCMDNNNIIKMSYVISNGFISKRVSSHYLGIPVKILKKEFLKYLYDNNIRWNPEINNLETFEKIRWQPKHGEHYYYLLSYGEILAAVYDEYCESDKIRIAIGNFFKTEKQAEAAAEKFKKLFADIQANLYK